MFRRTRTATTAPTVTPTPAAPSVGVTALPNDLSDTLDVQVSVDLPRPADLASRAANLGVSSVVDALTAACHDDPAVRRWRKLGDQVAAAEKKVKDAETTIRRVEAAKVLLENNLDTDLANKLRAVEAELAQAVANKEAAERDLATVRHLIPKHWIPAAEAIASTVRGKTITHLISVDERIQATEAKVREATEQISGLLQRAVAESLAPLAAELLALRRASRDGWAVGKDKAVADVRLAAIGSAPAGVRLSRETSRFEEVPPEPIGPVVAAKKAS